MAPRVANGALLTSILLLGVTATGPAAAQIGTPVIDEPPSQAAVLGGSGLVVRGHGCPLGESVTILFDGEVLAETVMRSPGWVAEAGVPLRSLDPTVPEDQESTLTARCAAGEATIVVVYVHPEAGVGYRLAGADGAVFAFGDATFLGSVAGRPLAAPVVDLAGTPDDEGYHLVAADGGVFAFGDAPFLGSAVGLGLAEPIVAIAPAPTPTATGYWLLGRDGGVFVFGDAPFLGSGYDLPAPVRTAEPFVDIVAVGVDGRGYLLVQADGEAFAFGVVPGNGPLLGAPQVAMAFAAKTGARWGVGADGEVTPIGGSTDFGDVGGVPLAAPVTAADADQAGAGYWLTAADGGVFAFGSARFYGSAAGLRLAGPVVAVDAVQRG